MRNLTVYCKDFYLTETIKNYLEDKLSSLYKYLNKDEESVNFNARLGKLSNSTHNGKIYYVEVSVHTPEKNYGARMEEEDLYAAIDLLKDELMKNITTYRDRKRTLSKKDAQKFKHELHNMGNID